jgi:hypothetical protein
MRVLFRAAPSIVLAAFCTAAAYLAIVNYPTAQAQIEPSRGDTAPPPSGAQEPTVTVLDRHDVQGVLGKEVRSAANENMGRIVDVIVDRAGQVKAQAHGVAFRPAAVIRIQTTGLSRPSGAMRATLPVAKPSITSPASSPTVKPSVNSAASSHPPGWCASTVSARRSSSFSASADMRLALGHLPEPIRKGAQ